MQNKFIYGFLISLIFLLGSCGGGKEGEVLVAKGGKMYGGEFRFMSSEKINTLFPTYSSDIYSMRLVSQLFEPLLAIDPVTLEVVPSLAESFSVSNDATVYTFKLRKGVYFHEDPCFGGDAREFEASDAKFTLDIACSGLKENLVSYLLVNRVKGAQAYFDQTKKTQKLTDKGVEGIKVIDKHTIQITLIKSFAGFESILTHSSLGISAPESYKKYGKDVVKHPVGTGPFMLAAFGKDKIVLNRNPKYWQKDEFGNQLPFMDKVVMTYSKDKRSELMAFRKQEVDLVLEIPVEEIEHILGTLIEAQEGKNVKHKVESEQSMSMMYVAMACESDEFKDERVRKAFNQAVNREVIIDEWLEGEGWAALNGFVPNMPNYESDKVRGHSYNPERAKGLMAQAGYPNGKGFPALDFYVNTVSGSGTHRACQSIAKQLKENLNIDLNIKLCTLDEREQAIQNGSAKIWRSGWVADSPDPENFLSLFYSGNIQENASMVNAFKFRDSEFDKLYEQALMEPNTDKRIDLLRRCDQIVIDRAAVMPVMTDDHIVLYNARIRNFEATPLEMMNLTSVYIKEPKSNK